MLNSKPMKVECGNKYFTPNAKGYECDNVPSKTFWGDTVEGSWDGSGQVHARVNLLSV